MVVQGVWRGGGGGAGNYIPTARLSPPFPSLISLMVSVDVKHHIYLLTLLLPECNKVLRWPATRAI